MRYSLIILLLSVTSLFSQTLTIRCINVGWGDCTLIEAPNGTKILVDAGNYYSSAVRKLTSYLDTLGVDTLDYLIATHYHSDHIGGVNNLVDSGFVFLSAYDRAYDYGAKDQFDEYIDAIGAIRHTATDGQIFDLGDSVFVEIVAMNGNGLWQAPYNNDSRENDYSIAMIVDYHDFQFFLGGDIGAEVESTLVTENIGEVEVYRVDHHGSATSSCQYFLDHISPQISIISNGSSSYDFPDSATLYRLQQISTVYQTEGDNGNIIDGTVVIQSDGDSFNVGTQTGIDNVNVPLPYSATLFQNYPNPFNASTTIKYSLPHDEYVVISIYDLLGRKISTLDLGYQAAGSHFVYWDAADYASGVYFYSLKAGEFTEAKKMVLIK